MYELLNVWKNIDFDSFNYDGTKLVHCESQDFLWNLRRDKLVLL